MGEATPKSTSEAGAYQPTEAQRRLGMRMIAWTRFIVIVPIVGLFLGAIAMVALATVEAFTVIAEVISLEVSLKTATIGFIEVADVYLLAIVLYIIALGLFELFIDDRLPLPAWLEIHDLEDLKEKLVSVVIVVLGVFFLGKVIEGTDYLEVLYLGAGIALMITALTYFVGRVLGKRHK